MWQFDETTNEWTELEQYGDAPNARSGHSLHVYGDYLILFGGILEITKEQDMIYMFHIPSKNWKHIDMGEGP